MEETKIEVEKTTESQAPVTETNPVEEKKEESNEENPQIENPIVDYKAEFERVSKQLGKAEFTIKKLKAKNESPKEEVEPGLSDKEEQFITKNEMEELLIKQADELKKEIQKKEADTYARKLARNDDEYRLIMLIYQNSIKSTGNLEEDIENAHLLANKSRFKSEISELTKALQSKQNRSVPVGAGQKTVINPPIKLTSEQEKIVKYYFGGDVKKFLEARKKNS